MAQTSPFVLGVNYWPRKKAMYWWKDFERGEVESEFAEIAALGLQVARIFLALDRSADALPRHPSSRSCNRRVVPPPPGEVGEQSEPGGGRITTTLRIEDPHPTAYRFALAVNLPLTGGGIPSLLRYRCCAAMM